MSAGIASTPCRETASSYASSARGSDSMSSSRSRTRPRRPPVDGADVAVRARHRRHERQERLDKLVARARVAALGGQDERLPGVVLASGVHARHVGNARPSQF